MYTLVQRARRYTIKERLRMRSIKDLINRRPRLDVFIFVQIFNFITRFFHTAEDMRVSYSLKESLLKRFISRLLIVFLSCLSQGQMSRCPSSYWPLSNSLTSFFLFLYPAFFSSPTHQVIGPLLWFGLHFTPVLHGVAIGIFNIDCCLHLRFHRRFKDKRQ